MFGPTGQDANHTVYDETLNSQLHACPEPGINYTLAPGQITLVYLHNYSYKASQGWLVERVSGEFAGHILHIYENTKGQLGSK